MKRWNLFLTLAAIIALTVTAAVLNWLRLYIGAEVERAVTTASAAFNRPDLTHGPGGDQLVNFALAEDLVGRAKSSPYIIDARLSRRAADGREASIVPYTALADQGVNWTAAFGGWRQADVGPADHPFGRLYLLLDRSVLVKLHLAIGAVAAALVIVLTLLLARLFTQESGLTRTRVELNERRRELIRMERLALGGQLAAGLIHDLRKPVQNIRHNLEEINEALGDFASAATSLQELREQTGLFFRILAETQLERFVQSDRVGEEYLEIGQIVEQSVSLVRYERRSVEVTVEVKAGLPLVLAQPPRLIQLFSNLILNAYQAMQSPAMKEPGRLTVRADAEGATVIVAVMDNGPGVPPELAERVFDPFFTTREAKGGSGMGLSICRMIIEEMGGKLTLTRPEGGGTAFVVQIPADTATTAG